MSSAWIETYSGLKFDVLDPQPDMICIEDIAHAGSQMNRFTGHCRFPYPVTQHERIGSYIIEPEFALDFLVHDSVESYIGDMNRPLKHFSIAGDEYRKVEAKIWKVVSHVFGVAEIEPTRVKEVDNQMLHAEKQQLMPCTYSLGDAWAHGVIAADIKIVETSFYENKRLYLDRFYQLYNK
jgi:5'-nucleotidase